MLRIVSLGTPRSNGAALWRRIGNTGKAQEWFDHVAEEVDEEVDEEGPQHWILAAAEQQRTDPQEWFG